MIVIAAALLLVGGDQASLRRSFADCLKQANSEAKVENIGVDGFIAFVKSKCENAAAPFQTSLTDANVSHGMSKKSAASDAASQVDDYYSERLENYKIELEPLPPAKPH